MIASLRGKILSKSINNIVLDVNGVGYNIALSLASIESLPRDGEVFIHIHTLMRDNTLELYGFSTSEEKSMFEMLLKVAGIGPKTSLLILSGISPEELKHAILSGDAHKLTSIPGIGKKSAERIILELRERITKDPVRSENGGKRTSSSFQEDLVSSLVNLGYKDKIAQTTAQKILSNAPQGMSLTEAIRQALKELMK